jgi:hypothetical protein
MTDPSRLDPEAQGTTALDKVTRFASEELARAFDRRSFLKRAGGGAFLFLAALASGQALGGRTAGAQAPGQAGPRPTPAPAAPTAPCCSPPGFFCNLNGVNEPNGCQGGNCYQYMVNGEVYNCTLYYQFYATGCWTTNCQGGYYTCCDCECFNGTGGRQTCGCAQFSGTPWRATD